ncbi:efflux RND transporter periplasmic adaptor subunit [Maritimibacter alkaliphilus]|uniref:efflux RND transporter periplasmic adaptor subunit n=1 Tax=Maritimibacter alkaliphilus TaxID=404236 RepID=UPI001C93D814|nr:efflux RND transporter periplasmic adaptor subunit [Maritimibacter alkaliphilus]MBY6092741.1 efflux RND transporter periplasmic adaptor subunit [Maritimibacter alkaliphilus]
MRLFPLLTAVAVTVFLYLLVIERDALLAFARGEGLEEAVAVAQAEDTPAMSPESLAASAEKTQEAAPVRVVATHSTAREIDSAVIVRGQTKAAREVDLMAETTGRVISEPLRKGTMVEDGAALCQLDPGTRQATLAQAQASLAEAEAARPTATARVAEAEAALDEAQITFTVRDRLKGDGFSSDTQLASARAAVRAAEASVASAKSGLTSADAAVEAAQASVASAQNEITKLTITAPFGGLLESDTAELGTLLQSGSLCATVTQLDPVKLVAYVPELQVDRVKMGAMAAGRLASGGAQVRGQVTYIARSADPETRTFQVEVTVANPDLAIRDGQTVEMSISAEGVLAHLLPQSVLTLNDDGVLGVRVVDGDSKAAFVPVTLMRDTATGVWLTGLPEQADVIVIGQDFVIAGVPVAATFAPPAEGAGQ